MELLTDREKDRQKLGKCNLIGRGSNSNNTVVSSNVLIALQLWLWLHYSDYVLWYGFDCYDDEDYQSHFGFVETVYFF